MKRVKYYDKNGFFDMVTIPGNPKAIEQKAQQLEQEARKVDFKAVPRPTPDIDARWKIANRLRDKAKFVRSFK